MLDTQPYSENESIAAPFLKLFDYRIELSLSLCVMFCVQSKCLGFE